MARKILALALLGAAALLSNGCSGLSQGSVATGGGGNTGGTTGTPQFIGGTVIGLAGTGLVLEDNGKDDITITGTGNVTFKFPNGATKYSVTVKTQPSNPAQNCVVVNGIGTATAAVTNVQIDCVQVINISGTVMGLSGTGLVLQNNGGDNLAVTGAGNVAFTFATPVAVGKPYAVTVLTQPSTPKQTCTVVNGSGTTNIGFTPIQVLCPQPTLRIGGTLIGLVNGPGNTIELLNNAGDNTFVTGNDTSFQFPTPVTINGKYNVSIFVNPTSQPQPCFAFFYTGVAVADVTSIIIDCQHNDWTWRSGPTTGEQIGTYLPSTLSPSTSTPGGRDFAAAWTDSSGRHWLFGGFGLELKGKTPPDIPGLLSDLWYFDPSNGNWGPGGVPITTVSQNGSFVSYPLPTQCGLCSSSADVTTFQTIDGAAPSGPGARWGSVTWNDAAGNLWLFGGQGLSSAAGAAGLLNDIWKFTPGSQDKLIPGFYFGSNAFTGTWTPVANTTTANNGGTYGTLGSPGGFPGGRWGAGFASDASGNVWMFGGQGIDSTGALALLNDLWKYSKATGQWTWMGPTNSNIGQNNGVYGTLNTALAANAPGPGGRQTPVLWADNTGNIWVFGGLGLDSVGTRNSGAEGSLPPGVAANGALLNDLWKFNIATQQWTWVSGGGATGLADQTGVYGTQLIGATTNFPGSRWSPVGWADSNGNLWFFGGWGYASALAQSTGFLNDVWEFVPSSGQWVWWKGSSDVNQNGNYPTQFGYNVPFTLSTPGSRRGMSFWQQDNLDFVYVFGGQGYDSTNNTSTGYLNDFWSYLGYPHYPN